MFDSDLLDKLSRVHPSVPVILFLPAILVLLGLAFTTFVLTWAVWAIAGISVALGDPVIGVAVGVAFGIGRALPVVAMAPSASEGRGASLLQTMAERPAALLQIAAVLADATRDTDTLGRVDDYRFALLAIGAGSTPAPIAPASNGAISKAGQNPNHRLIWKPKKAPSM